MTTTLREHVIHAGVSRRQADRVIHAVVVALGGGLDDPEARLVSRALPRRLAAVLRMRPFDPRTRVESLCNAVEHLEPAAPSEAREHLQLVCRAIAESLPGGSRRALQDHLPSELAALFDVPEATDAPAYPPRHAPPGHHSLATGEPASTHPISESPPPGAAAHSVGEPNPHGATKLSSARSLTQDALGESLSAAHPDGKRTIARARG